jgi:hypothetical protein
VSTAQFYDGLADTYHALYPDWRSESRAQGEALHRTLSRWHPGPADVAEPKTAKNRIHLDLIPPDGEPRDELARLLRLGAVIAEDQPPGASWVILTDPEGNEFCLEHAAE